MIFRKKTQVEDRKKQSLKKTYKGENLHDADFRGTDLRGINFEGTILSNADFSGCRTGLKPSSASLIFIVSLAISLLSGYIAMLTGSMIRLMIASEDSTVVTTGYITFWLMISFLFLTAWKGGKVTLISLPVSIAVMLMLGLIARLTETGTGRGAVLGSLALVLFLVMVLVGTISRAAAGTMSSTVIFLLVAMSGPMFGKFVFGGQIGTVILAVSCAIISKRALSDTDRFPLLKNVALKTGAYFGTSFVNADLSGANFSESLIKNTNFKGAKLINVNWENSKKEYILEDSQQFIPD
jgi:hypothetical protein